jgi:NitT/TauT family transport system substrate-binding protein
MVNRGAWLFLLAILLCGTGYGCRRAATNRAVLRLGYFPNLTHAAAMNGVESGRFASAMRGVRLETRLFNAGPAAMEALLSGALDIVYVGPSPALNAWNATRGRGLRVIAGAASGGTLFVVRPAANIRDARDLHGKRIGTPQLGNTQDVALRSYLRDHGLDSTERGGDVTVVPIANSEILTQFRLGHLDGAWVPEPWASRLIAEAGATIFVDERDIWPDHRFPITLVVARQQYLDDAPDVVQRFLRAHVAEIERLRTDSIEGMTTANRALAHLQGRALPDAIVAAAWPRIEFTADVIEPALRRNAQAARALGFLRTDDLGALVDQRALSRARAAATGAR